MTLVEMLRQLAEELRIAVKEDHLGAIIAISKDLDGLAKQFSQGDLIQIV